MLTSLLGITVEESFHRHILGLGRISMEIEAYIWNSVAININHSSPIRVNNPNRILHTILEEIDNAN